MTRYQRYQPVRRTYRSSGRRWSGLGWTVAILVVAVLAWNGLTGDNDKKESKSKNASITLANGNGNTNTAIATPAIDGREITANDCSKVITAAATSKSFVALTLDVGGSVIGEAKQLATALKDQKIPATLFANGQWAEANKDVVTAYADAGIDIMNRGYSRTAYTALTKEEIAADLKKADTAIAASTSKSTKPYFRPPLGTSNETTISETRKNGYCTITWTVDALDTQDGMTVDQSVSRVSKSLKNGAIILMHANSDIAVELAPALAQEVKDKGYTLVTLRDLLRISATATNTNSSVTQNSNVNRSN